MSELNAKNVSITDQLRPFTSSLKNVKEEFERVLLHIASDIPEVEEQITSKIYEAEEVLNELCSPGQNTVLGVKKDLTFINEQILKAIATTKDLEKQDAELYADFKQSMDMSSQITSRMGDILSISENLKVFAINSIVHAQNIGNNGKGYQIISSEFIALSGKIAEQTAKITRLGNQLEGMIEKDLLKSISSYEEILTKYLKDMTDQSSTLLENTFSSVDIFYNNFTGILNRIMTIQEPIGQVMMEIQRQDIIHQQLEHLLESIEDILHIVDTHPQDLDSKSDYSSLKEKDEHISILTLLHVLVVNIENQMTRINGEILQLMGHMESSFKTMHLIIKDIRSKDFLRTGSNPKTHIVNTIFDVPDTMVHTFKESLKILNLQKGNITDIHVDIVSKINEEKHNARAFIPVIESINNLLLLAKIEQARYSLNISALNGKDHLGFSQDSINVLLEIISDIEKSSGLVAEDLERSKVLLVSQKAQFTDIEKDLNQSLAQLTESKNLFDNNLSQINSIIDILFKELQHYLAQFGSLKKTHQEMVDKLEICTSIRMFIDDRLNSIGGEVDLEKCSFKDVILQKIVQKFTVMQERETLHDKFKDLEIEDDGQNSITLF